MNKEAINEFCRIVRGSLGTNLQEILLFGSMARGTSTSESDIDILVVVKNEDGLIRDKVIDITVDINIKYDVVISPIIMSKERYRNPLFQQTHFHKSVEKEGISI